MTLKRSVALLASKPLTLFKLTMMTVIAIDSLKNLPANAQYGSSLLVFYTIAILIFFIPSALVSAELATTWPQTGGIYIWVREAFNKRMAFVAVWIQWLFMVIWYPSILSFTAVTLAYLINPELAENKAYVISAILIIFWGATYINAMGIKISSMVCTITAILGAIIPMIFITALGGFWLHAGNVPQIDFSIVSFSDFKVTEDNLRLFISLLFSLMGMDMIAVHAGDVSNPQRDYPRALIFSAVIILLTVIPASLAIAMVVPTEAISLTGGIMEGFDAFFNAFNLNWLQPIVIMAIVIGCFGIFFTWLIAATRCLLIAGYDNSLPQFLTKTNSKNMPVNLLLTQGVIFTILCYAFVLLPSINTAFWLLTASSAQLALIYYLFLFGSALRLRYKYPNIVRPFSIGKHPATIWIVCLVAMIACIIAIACAFIPPSEIDESNLFLYEFFLCALMITGCVSGVIIYQISQSKSNKIAVAKIYEQTN